MTRSRNPTCSVVSNDRTIKDWSEAGGADHFVQFYRTDDYLIDCLAGYVAKGLLGEENAVVIATGAHRLALEDRLRLKHVDVANAVIAGRYLSLDAQEVLAKFMVNGRPNPDAFRDVVGELVRNATAGGKPLRAFGEMVALLWAEDNREAAIELEQLWTDLGSQHRFSLFCAYPADCVTPKDGRPGLEHICRTHSCLIAPAA